MFAHKRLHMILIFAISILSFPVFADAPTEKYHVTYTSIAKDVLKNTIGILTINSGTRGGTALRVYTRMADRFVADSSMKVEETTPLSSFGYHGDASIKLIENYRYPIIETIGSHARIVYDPVKSLSAWINLEETEHDFYTKVTLLSDLDALSKYYVDIHGFTKSGRRKIYESPEKDAQYAIVAKSSTSLLKVIEIGEEFVKLGKPRFNNDWQEEGIDPVGWIRIRDDEGKLTFWLTFFDNC